MQRPASQAHGMRDELSVPCLQGFAATHLSSSWQTCGTKRWRTSTIQPLLSQECRVQAFWKIAAAAFALQGAEAKQSAYPRPYSVAVPAATQLMFAVAGTVDSHQMCQILLTGLAERPQLFKWLGTLETPVLQGVVSTWAREVPRNVPRQDVADFMRSEKREQDFSGFANIMEARKMASQAVGLASQTKLNEVQSRSGRRVARAGGSGSSAYFTLTKVSKSPGAGTPCMGLSAVQLFWLQRGYERACEQGIVPVPAAQAAATAQPQAAPSVQPVAAGQPGNAGAVNATPPSDARSALASHAADERRAVASSLAGSSSRRERPDKGTEHADTQPRKAAKTLACVDLCSP
jgi:hypothetical protein